MNAIGLVAVGVLAAAGAFSLPFLPPEKESPMKAEHATTPAVSKSGFRLGPLSKSEIETLAQKLTPDEAKVILKKGTEPAFCGNLVDNHKEGTYVCRLCGLPLFASDS